MATTNLIIPDLGGAENVEVIEVCVAIGDVVSEGDSIIVVETDKASMEIPASQAGTISAISVKEGAVCNMGDTMAVIEVVAEDAAVESDAAPAEKATEKAPEEPSLQPVESPSVVNASVAMEKSAQVPDLGGAADVEIIEVSVKVGDEVAEGDSLVVVETDKASMEIPAAFSGTVLSLSVSEGAKVNVGDELAVLQSQAAASVASAPAEAVPVAVPNQVSAAVSKPEVQASAQTPKPVNTASASSVHAGPAVRMLAREFGVELNQVVATGPKGRVIKEDIQAFFLEASMKWMRPQ